MKVTATEAEKLEILYSALCNGLESLRQCGLTIDVDQNDYVAQRNNMPTSESAICYEDILIEMIRNGKAFKLVDSENDDAVLGEISLFKLNRNWSKIPLNILADFAAEQDDADSANGVLQVVAMGSIEYS